jgi:hypothetical protein
MKYQYPFKQNMTETDLRNLVINLSEAIYKKPCRFTKGELDMMDKTQLKREIEALYNYARYYSVLKESELIAVTYAPKEVPK